MALAASLAGTPARAAEAVSAPDAGAARGKAATGGAARDAAGAERRASAGPAQSGRDTVTVLIDHAKIIRLPDRTQTVVVGNPIIADVTVQKNGILVVTGRSYGVTNLIALDGAGSMLAESMISVQAPQQAVVTVQRGLDRESYSCTPTCQPSMLLGDNAKYFGEVGGQATQRNGLATSR